jgi:hypothetical protein
MPKPSQPSRSLAEVLLEGDGNIRQTSPNSAITNHVETVADFIEDRVMDSADLGLNFPNPGGLEEGSPEYEAAFEQWESSPQFTAAMDQAIGNFRLDIVRGLCRKWRINHQQIPGYVK